MERKVKYNLAFKLECVKLVLEKHYSAKHVSKLKNVADSEIRKWVSFYKKYGKTGLIPKKNQCYSAEYKLKVIQTIEKLGLSVADACLKFNIPAKSVIIVWQRNFAKFGLEGLKPKDKGRPKAMDKNKRKTRKTDKPLTREEELLKEIERLNCENDLLKKLHALIQAEESKKLKP